MKRLLIISLAIMSLFSCKQNTQAPLTQGEMDTFEAIAYRKSVRSFNDREIEPEKLKAIVEAGNMAAGTPTVGKRYFTVITDKAFLQEIKDATKAEMGKSEIPQARMISKVPGYDPLFGATALVIISGDKQDNPFMDTIVAQNMGCAGENILLAATALGIGSHYVGAPVMAFNDPAVRERAKMAEDVKPVAAILLGYTDDMTPHKARPENPDNIQYIR